MNTSATVEERTILLRIVSDIENILNSEEQGVTNTNAINSISSLVLKARRTGPDENVKFKFASIDSFSKILFSARKHKRYGDNGVEIVRGFIAQDISVLKGILRD